jgi:DNA-directed RNA polymerase subunit M/transcription elongation factor TFIIS
MLSDPAAEFLRISDHYRQMSDNEILALARHPERLTDQAQQALASEMHHRRLKAEPDPEETPAPAVPLVEPDTPDSPYFEERELVELRTVWSLQDALQIQTLLDRAGIPFFIGPEKATSVDHGTADFSKGVGVRIMRIGIPWARQAMTHYFPKDEPPPQEDEQLDELPVRCPRCQSTEVIFEELVEDSSIAGDGPADIPAQDSTDATPAKFQWTCDACGHHWQDDGIAKN